MDAYYHVLSSGPTHENVRGHSHVGTKRIIQSVMPAGFLMGITVRKPAGILV